MKSVITLARQNGRFPNGLNYTPFALSPSKGVVAHQGFDKLRASGYKY